MRARRAANSISCAASGSTSREPYCYPCSSCSTGHWAGRSIAALGLDIPVGIRGRLGIGLDAILISAYAFALLWRKQPQERIDSVRRRLDEFPLLPETRAQFLLYAAMGLVASPAEELLFRGFLLWAFAVEGGVWVAVLLSSAVFGLGHGYQGWRGIVRTAFIGFIFAIGFVLTHSLWWLMIAHVAVNLLGGLFAWRVIRLSSGIDAERHDMKSRGGSLRPVR